MVLNGFNEVPIHKKAWRAGIQPKARVAMAILLESGAVRKGRCADPSCPGKVEFGDDEVALKWYVRNRNIIIPLS